MITNLRYHIDGKNILVRWNYEDIDIKTVHATCRLVKRINGETVNEISNINWNTFHQNGGGCTFEMPDYPVRVEVEEQTTQGDPVTIYRNVKEAPRYQLESKVRMRIQAAQMETSSGLFGWRKQTHDVYVNVDADCELFFPNSLTETEVKQLPGWLVAGHYDHPNGNDHEIFFWPDHFHLGANKLTLRALPLSEKDRQPERYGHADEIPMGRIWFEITSVANNTEYADLFLINQVENSPDSSETEEPSADSREIKVKQIHLDCVKPKTNGLYPIVCPFCMKKMEPHQPVFRAAILDSAGYPVEADKEYADFWGDKRKNMLGHVFKWGDNDIKAYATAEDPNTFTETSECPAPESGVVVAVRYSKDDRVYTTSDKLCVHCHNSIPVYSGFYPSVFIGMMGYTGSGKTVYKDCTIHMLQKQKLLPGYKLLCTANNNLASIENMDRFSMLIGTSSNPHSASTSASVSDSMGQSLETKPGNMDGQALDNQSLESYGGINLGSQSLGSPNDTNLGGQERAGLDDTGLGSQILSGTDSMEPGSINLSEPQNVVDLSAGMSLSPANSQSSANLADMLSELTAKMEIQPPRENTHEARQQLPGATAVEKLEPYIYQLRSVDGKNGIIMCFFDFPGEVLDPNNSNTAYQQDYKNLLAHFDGMVFLFDPMMLSCIQQMEMDLRLKFASYTYQAKDKEAVQHFMEKTPCRILEYFRSKFLPVGQLQMPVVFAISKSDAIRDHVPVEKWRNLPFMDESINGGCSDRIGLDLEEIESNSRAVLEFQGDPLLENMGRAIADKHVWMCVSATGIAPKDGTMEGRYGNPVRVMEPLEWILYQNQLQNDGSPS